MDIGWSELLVVGIVALIVIGPKDLPGLFRTLGRFTARARGMAREFTRAMEAAADESGVNDMARDLKTATNPRAMGLDAVKDAAAKFEKWDPLKPRPAPAAPPAAAPAAPPAAPATDAMGPETRALAEAQAARRATLATATVAQPDPQAPAPNAAAAPPGTDA